MKVVYVNKLPDPFALEVDGRLSLAPLELYPASISFQGVMALVGPDGTTKRNWTDVVQLLVELGKCTVELGTQANPLQVAGNPMSGHGLAIVQDILLPHVLLDRLQKQMEIQGYLLQGHSRLLQDLIEAYQ